jgi:hypothetical protein
MKVKHTGQPLAKSKTSASVRRWKTSSLYMKSQSPMPDNLTRPDKKSSCFFDSHFKGRFPPKLPDALFKDLIL